MSRAKRLANHIERTVTGSMWHGPALVDVLDGVVEHGTYHGGQIALLKKASGRASSAPTAS